MVVTVFLKARAVSRQNEEVFTNGFADSSPWSLDRFPLSKGDFQNAGVHRDICPELLSAGRQQPPTSTGEGFVFLARLGRCAFPSLFCEELQGPQLGGCG